MTDKDILAGAPKDATHYAEGMHYLALNANKKWMRYDPNGIGKYRWFEADEYKLSYMRSFRSLADIALIVELKKERDANARQAHRFAVFLCKTVEKLDGIPEFEPTKLLLSRLISGNELQAHNLEQRANEVEDFVSSYHGDNMDFSQAERRIENLRNKAKRLREPKQPGWLRDNNTHTSEGVE